MSETPGTRARDREGPSTARRARRIVIWCTVAVLVIAAVALAGFFAKKVADQVFGVRDDLTRAIPLATALPQKVISGDGAGAQTDAGGLKELSAQAVGRTTDWTWAVAEKVPFVGSNLTAVRVAAESVDAVADYAVDSVPHINLTAFQPKDGAIDLEAVHALSDAVSEGERLFGDLDEDLGALDRSSLDGRVESALTSLDDAIGRAGDMLGTAAPLLEVLPAALGEGGTHTYLLMFQGNSEVRASGGNPAAMALVTVTDGRIEMTGQAASLDFNNARDTSVVPLDAETENIYSDIIGRWIPNMTATPDFPTTVGILNGWWAEEGLPPFDSVISVDPVALSYLLGATGPVALATGDQLTSQNAVSLLLNEVYFRYTDLYEQDAFFASAAANIFSTLTSGISDPLAFVNALTRSTEEGRLKVWSSNPDMAALTEGTLLAGTLPTDNTAATVAGVYFNDTTGSKMDYYADAAITAATDQCTATGAPTFTQRIVFANAVTPEVASGLPRYITGPFYAPGTIATDVVVYSPVGASIESWSVTGAESYRLIREGSHLGRDVVRISVITPPQAKATIDVAMKGADGVAAADYGDFEVRTTPMVRETPVTIDAPGCGK